MLSSERSDVGLPEDPPLQTADLPAPLGKIGPDPEDFIVEEVPAYAPAGKGEHLYLWIEKRGVTTPEVEKRLARALGIHSREVGYAGMKDKNAITRQWFSALTKGSGEGLELGPGVQVLETNRHENKLRTGHLRGNRFIITLHGVENAAAADALRERLLAQGLNNYFGSQRFGFGGRNLGQALTQFAGGGDSRKRGRAHHFDLKFHASVLQAELFNRYLTRRRLIPDPLLVGEVVRLENSSRCFIVEDLEAELPRLAAGDIHPTGPMLGPKMLAPRGRPLELEEELTQELLGANEALRAALFDNAPGTRRDLAAKLDTLTIEKSAPDRFVLSFELPSGSYATQLIREFVRGPFLEAQRERAQASVPHDD